MARELSESDKSIQNGFKAYNNRGWYGLKRLFNILTMNTWPSFRPGVFDILCLLKDIGLDKVKDENKITQNLIAKWQEAILEDEEKNVASGQVTQEFINKLYEIFEVLNKRKNIDRAALHQLKKYIHRYVEKNKIAPFDGNQEDVYDKRIVNFKKAIYRILEKGKLSDDETNYLNARLQAIKNGEISLYIVVPAGDIRNWITTDFQTWNDARKEKREQTEGKQKEKEEPENSMLDGFEEIFEELRSGNNLRHKKRGLKLLLHLFSIAIAVCIAIGEASVNLAFLLGLGLIAPYAVPMAATALATNFFLFRGDSRHVLRTIALGKIFKDQHDQPVSLAKKFLILLSLLTSGSGGAALGALSFHSALISLPKVLAIIIGVSAAASVPPLGIAIAAGFIGAVTAIALANAYFVSSGDFIKNERYKNIKGFFKEHYGYVGDLTVAEKCQHYVKCFLLTALLLAFAGLTVAAVAATGGRYYHAMRGFLQNSAYLSVKLSTVAGAIIIFAFAQPSNLFFGLRGSAGVFEMTVTNIRKIGKAIAHPLQTFRNLRHRWDNYCSMTRVGEAGLEMAAIANGAGQGAGMGARFVGGVAGGIMNIGGMGTAGLNSFCVNAVAIAGTASSYDKISAINITRADEELAQQKLQQKKGENVSISKQEIDKEVRENKKADMKENNKELHKIFNKSDPQIPSGKRSK